MAPITVIVADDEPMIRAALAEMLDQQPGVRVVAEATDAAGAVAMARLHHPTVALLDVRMPGGGAEAARGIRLVSPVTRVVAHSASDDLPTRCTMLAAGAGDFIVKGTPSGQLAARVLAAARPSQATDSLGVQPGHSTDRVVCSDSATDQRSDLAGFTTLTRPKRGLGLARPDVRGKMANMATWTGHE
jgi:DNA-binding NarL/FixJ family response regulator